ncbi:MAG: ester cyclase [Candidatus Marinarcus sp.]|uniref:ester cyclase n=1 Tax=Candidatus Marinarcus sp. TaxID=3100987 RepID=UPI003AFFFC50
MNIKSNRDLVKVYYEELWNKNNKEYIDILFDDNITFHGSLDINAVGKKEFEEYMDNILTGIPNLFHGIELMICEGDYIAVRAIYNGTHKGKIFNFEPTGNRIKYNGASFFKFKDGKIIDVWVLGDLNSLNKQLQ